MKSKSIPFRITGLVLGASSIGFAFIIGLSDDDIDLLRFISMLVVGVYFVFFGLTGFSSVVSYINRNAEKD